MSWRGKERRGKYGLSFKLSSLHLPPPSARSQRPLLPVRPSLLLLRRTGAAVALISSSSSIPVARLLARRRPLLLLVVLRARLWWLW